MTDKKEQPYIHIDPLEKRAELPDVGNTDGLCPECGGVLEDGFGLAGGGYGPYEYCSECGTVATKTVVEE